MTCLQVLYHANHFPLIEKFKGIQITFHWLKSLRVNCDGFSCSKVTLFMISDKCFPWKISKNGFSIHRLLWRIFALTLSKNLINLLTPLNNKTSNSIIPLIILVKQQSFVHYSWQVIQKICLTFYIIFLSVYHTKAAWLDFSAINNIAFVLNNKSSWNNIMVIKNIAKLFMMYIHT